MAQIYQPLDNSQAWSYGPIAAAGIVLSIRISALEAMIPDPPPLSRYAVCYDDQNPFAGLLLAFGEFVAGKKTETFIRQLTRRNNLTAGYIAVQLLNHILDMSKLRRMGPVMRTGQVSPDGSILYYDPLSQIFHWAVVGRGGATCLWGGYVRADDMYHLFCRVDRSFSASMASENLLIIADGALEFLTDDQLGYLFYGVGQDLLTLSVPWGDREMLDPLHRNLADHCFARSVELGYSLGTGDTLFALYLPPRTEDNLWY